MLRTSRAVQAKPARAAALLVVLLAACSPSPQPNGRIGRVDGMSGEVVLLHDGQRHAAAVGAAVAAGDKLETAAGAKVQVTLSDQSVIAIGGGTTLEINELLLDGDARTGRIAIAAGKFWMHVKKWTRSGASLYEITTPNAVAGVRGTTLWGDTEVDAICALDGTVEVRSVRQPGLAPATLTTGHCAGALSQGKLEPLMPGQDQIDAYLKDVLIPSAPRETR